MTLSDLTTQVSTVTGFVEDDDISAIKNFLTAKHRLMWNHQLWKDSLVEYNVTLSPDDYTPDKVWLPTAGVLLLPPTIQKVLAVRSSDYHMNVQRQEYYYRIDYNAFAAQGSPYEFVVLPPCVWQMDGLGELLAVLSNAEDISQVITTDMLKGDGVSYLRYLLTTSALETYFNLDVAAYAAKIPPCFTNQIGAIIKPTGNGAFTMKVVDYPTTVLTNNDVASATFSTVNTDGNTVDYVVAAGESETVQGRMTSVWIGLSSITQTPFGGTFTWDGMNVSFAITPYTLCEMLATDVAAPKRQRIRFVQIPNVPTTVRVLGKRNPPSFSNDSDEPAITGCEDYLIAFASAQMWERARQFSKKQLLMAEADALLGDLVKQETVQQAHHVQIVPENGMGGDYYAYCGYWGNWP